MSPGAEPSSPASGDTGGLGATVRTPELPTDPINRLLDRLDPLDRFVDRISAPWHGNAVADALAYGASALGDHGLVWFLIGLARARRPARRRSSLRAVALTGITTPVVNLGVKAVVGRARPPAHEDHPLPLRIPRTASFPSGHTLAAWCAATLLAEGDPLAPTYYALAGIISLSRIHVRLHHASDVAGGMVIGIGIGALFRLMVPAGGSSEPSGFIVA